MGNFTPFWSATDGTWGRNLNYNQTKFFRYSYDKDYGFSVRCIKGELELTNIAPTASFIISPASGTPKTNFFFDASGCTDAEDDISQLQVRWDWENDGEWDTNYNIKKTQTHKYTTPETYTVRLEVKDSAGDINETTKIVTVEDNIGNGVTDIDNNTYKTVIIGNQEWMAENLKVTRYRNGETISDCWSYDNDDSNADIFGRLYSWLAVNDIRNIAPAGWHVPTDEEWKELEMALGMTQSEADDTGWRGTNIGSKLADRADLWLDGTLENNAEFGTSGFAALPAGSHNTDSNFNNVGYSTHFWSVSVYINHSARGRSLKYDNATSSRHYGNKDYGFSVRCVRD